MRHCDGFTCTTISLGSGSLSFLERQKPRYQNGYKYCTECEQWFETLQIRCICCKTVLRYKARHKTRVS